MVGRGGVEREGREGGFREGLYHGTVDGGDGWFVGEVKGHGVGCGVEGNIAGAQGGERGEQPSLLHEAAVRRGDERGVGAEGGGDEMDGVADVVVKGGFRVAGAVKEVVAIFVNGFPTSAAGRGGRGEKRETVGPAKGEGEAQVVEAVFNNLPAWANKGGGGVGGENGG